jgi:hypothetical protein
MFVYEGEKSIFLGARAYLIENDRDTAWAERKIHFNPAYKWVLGKYVEADNANNNGQLWTLPDLRASQKTITYAPMNMLHHQHKVVGAFVDTEMMYPAGDAAAAGVNPYIEALGVFWKYYFPEELGLVEAAHAMGQLFFSMECVSESVTCHGETGCGQTFAYAGPKSSSYCDHINGDTAAKRLDKPHFLAGALLIPPVKPGWSGAEIRDLSGMVKEHATQAEHLYNSFKEESPHLSPQEWEYMMGQVLLRTKV